MGTGKFLIFLLFFFIVPGFFNGHVSCLPVDFIVPENAIVRFGDWEPVYLEQFYLTNSIGGKGSITGYGQCVYVPAGMSNILIGWKWYWPDSAKGQVKAFPDICFGKTPWNEKSTTSLLPLQIGKIEEITVSYDILHQETGRSNLAFLMWVTNSPNITNPPEANVLRQIMIIFDEKVTGLNTTVIDKQEYGLLFATGLLTDKATQTQYKYDTLYFIKRVPEYSWDLKIHLFLEYLLANKQILSTDYLSNIDFGNNVWYGKGETMFNAYSITVKTGNISNTAALKNTLPLAVSMLIPRHAILKNAAQMKYDSSTGWEYIGWWTTTKEEIYWEFSVPQMGTYVITAQVACVQSQAGSTVDVIVDKNDFNFTVPDTGDWLNFTDLEIKKLDLKAGKHSVVVRASKIKSGFVCNLQSIIFSLQPD